MYKYNELAYAKLILEKGFTSKYINNELRVLAKYYKYIGRKPVEREKLLYEFCEKHLDDYDRVKYYKNINAALNHAKKKENKIIEINTIGVTDKEIEYIEKINLSKFHKMVAFSLLVVDKLNNMTLDIKHGKDRKSNHYYGGNEKKYRELSSQSCIPSSKRKKAENVHSLISDLANQNILEIKGNGYIHLKFIEEIPASNEYVININNFNNLGLYYELYIGEKKVKTCECCETPIRVNSNRTKYCFKCAKLIKNQKIAIMNKERRNQNRNKD